MDSETLVNQIVRSLSFEVVAAPQHVIPVDSSSKTTPVNVKLKVRKKQGSGLRHGVISMPQVDTRCENRKQEPRERIRLVSSDHTIMNFDILMEAEFEKGALPNQQNLNMIAPDLQGQDGTYKELNSSPIFLKRNKDIFGKCKPGGCLDPPFGEDRYPYQPTKQNLSQPLKDDSTKLRSSSIFKNNIFKRKRKGSQDYAQLDKPDPEYKAETDSRLQETESLTQHSNLIITYPHPSIPKKLQKQDEKRLSKEDDKSNKRNSSDVKSRSSSIDEGSYYVIPKKTKRLSNQSDTRDKLDIKPNGAKITFLNSEFENDDNNVTEIKPAPEKDSKFIPIPLIVPLNALTGDNENSGKLANNETGPEPFVELPLFRDDNGVDENASLEPETISDHPKKENESYTNMIDSYSQKFAPIEGVKVENQVDFLKFPFDESTDLEKKQSTSNDDKDLGGDSKSQIDPKSHPLLPDARQKSIIGITDNTLKIPEQNNVPYSSVNLKEIWENENDPLKSTADVIFRDNIPYVYGDTLSSDRNSTISTNSKKSLLHDVIAENIEHEHDLSPKTTVYSVGNEPVTSLESNKIPQSPSTSDDSKTKPQDNLTQLTDGRDEQPRESMIFTGTKSPTDKEEDPTNMILIEPIESNKSEDGTDTITIENMINLKKVRSVSDMSIMGSLNDKNLNEPKKADKDALPTIEPLIDTETTSQQISFKLDQVPIKVFSDAFSGTTDNVQVLQPSSILKKAFWKMDIALQSYIDENNERIIKSFDSKNTPQRHANDSVLVAQCYLGSDMSEIKIPVDLENDLNVRITQKTLGPKLPIADSGQDFVETPKKKSIKIATTASNILDATNQTKANKSDGRLDNDTRNALNKVYEEELLPLQDMIKGLREEIDALVSYQSKFKEVQRVTKLPPKRTRPVRLVQPNKRCSCNKKL